MMAGICREAYKILEGVNSLRRFGRISRIGRIGRMWERREVALGFDTGSMDRMDALRL